ncbi:ABC transporter permease [Desulfotomaculum copahuensis]|uniref:Peptide ABC transporter permease n=1 Tax=Desulfotomaculum copahuensis TaxID=1838280 RepID=A0A1B7LET8_9FIRM|nr:ABC transporter permease [Desulfotomaculum copahuensis]OAT81805.1 peptide ABC transporter permease [Desulfotomaculum copahuensis]
MTKYLLRRLVAMLIALWLIITLTFIIMHVVPGGPFATEKPLPPEILKNIMAHYHMNEPLWRQYTDYLGSLLHGDLGPSFKYQDRTVNGIIRDGFPVSAALGAVAIAIALLIGIPAGIVSALRRNSWQDYLAMALTTIGFSVPSFILAGLLMYVFAYRLGWLPPAMWGSPQQAIMPALALSALPMAFVARLMRSSMLEVLQQDYMRTARAKGLPERLVVWRHAVRNAITPVVTYLGPLVAGIFTGSFVVENIFAIPGLGRYYVMSITDRDYTVILGVTIFYSAFLMLMNFLVDLAYVFIDPRVKLAGRKEV